MRKIVTKDVFSALRLVQRSGLKDKLVPVIEKLAKEPDTLERSGIIGLLTIIEVFAEEGCENMIYEWLAGPCEVEPEQIANWDLDILSDNITKLAEANNLRIFFTSLSKLISQKR